MYVSVLVVGEIRQSIERLKRRDPEQATVFEAWLVGLKERYAGRILSIGPRRRGDLGQDERGMLAGRR